MTDQTSPQSPAERSRRYRERQRDVVRVLQIEIDKALLDGLVSYGFIAEESAKDRECIEDGVAILMKAVADKGISFRAEWIASFE